MLPSCVKSGYKPEDERNTRRRTCRFLEEASRKLKLPRVAISTSMVFFHRFFAVHSFADHDRFEVAVACLLLAAKTEESPKKLKDVIQICWSIKTQSAKKSVSSKGGASPVVGTPEAKVDKAMFLDVKGEEYTKLKERTLLLERVVLHTIGFELSVDHPYKFLVDQVSRGSSNALLCP
jgi:cyclin T